jgi:hypothetical protein
MNQQPIDPERITTEAQKAAWLYDTTTQANPYPWHTPEASIFCAAFDAAKKTQAEAGMNGVKVPTPSVDKMSGTYTPTRDAYYRNTGNPHVRSAGLPC